MFSPRMHTSRSLGWRMLRRTGSGWWCWFSEFGSGAAVAVTTRSRPQCLQTIAAPWISSAQKGHVFSVAADPGSAVAAVTGSGAAADPKSSFPQCGQARAVCGISRWQKRHFRNSASREDSHSSSALRAFAVASSVSISCGVRPSPYPCTRAQTCSVDRVVRWLLDGSEKGLQHIAVTP